MRANFAATATVIVLLAFAALAPGVRRHFLHDVITWDAAPSESVRLPAAFGAGLPSADRVRVILIDGLGADAARRLPVWSALCKRGLRLTVDIGFPTVSLPVEVSLWSGLTQQQTGVMFRSDRPLVPPLDRRGLPARVPDSIAIAENHGYIVRSLGFATAEPASTENAARDRDPDAWTKAWQARALEAVASPARLVFVHVLRVDTAGHRKGAASMEYAMAAGQSDAMLAELAAAAPDARWFLLSDHGHLPTGGHGGEERSLRQVEHCIVGPGVTPGVGGPVHLTDVSRAIADSLALPLDKRSPGRPMGAALKAPLEGDDAVPPLALGIGAIGVFIVALGLVATGWSMRRWWLAPWWFVLACLLLLFLRGVPTMSMPMVYGQDRLGDILDFDKRLMTRSWLVALPLAAAVTWFGLSRGVALVRVVVAQLALPVATLTALLVACGGWPALLGAEVSPMVPRYTALTSPLLLMASQGAAAVSLAVLARLVQQAFGRRRSSETPRSAT